VAGRGGERPEPHLPRHPLVIRQGGGDRAGPENRRLRLRPRLHAALEEAAPVARSDAGIVTRPGGGLGGRRLPFRMAPPGYPAVVGSIFLKTSVIFVAGKPLSSACLRMISSPAAR